MLIVDVKNFFVKGNIEKVKIEVGHHKLIRSSSSNPISFKQSKSPYHCIGVANVSSANLTLFYEGDKYTNILHENRLCFNVTVQIYIPIRVIVKSVHTQ